MAQQYPTAFALLATCLYMSFIGCTVQAENDQDVPEENMAYTGPIIDMHLHSFPEQSPMFGLTHPPTLRGETYKGVSSAAEQQQMTLQKLREHNVVMAMVENGDSWESDHTQILYGRGEQIPVDQLRQLHSEGKLDILAEMAPFYGQVRADDPSLEPYFNLAAELGIPVGFHVLPGGPNGGLHLMPQMLGGMRAANADPIQLEKVLVAHPEMKVYIMHGGWPFVEEVKALMYMHPQLYADVAVINWILPQEEFNSYLTELINAGFGDRIMYGSDQMAWPQVIDVGINAVNAAPITDQQKEDIFYNNAARFLGLSEEEIATHKE